MERHLGVWCSLTIIMLMISGSGVNSFNLDVDWPIIYEDHHPEGNESGYFGYSLGMYSNSSGSWIIIGAPKANYTDQRYKHIKEPGVVYQCSLSSLGKCDPIDLFSGKGYIPGENDSEYTDEEDLDRDKPFPDKGFMGGSMAIQGGSKGRLVICGPKTSFKTDEFPRQYGYCFWGHLDGSNMLPVSPFISETLDSVDSKNSPFGVAGFSVAMTEMRNATDLQRLFFGVPGFKRHRGASYLIRDGSGRENGRQRRGINTSDFSKFLGFIPYEALIKKVSEGFELFGYQVAVGMAGKLKRLFFVVSAPRANNLKGMVSYFNLNRVKPENVENYFGEQIGEYYGASVATGDLNDDGSDDIIVGAPFYSIESKREAYDEGRVEVIIKKQKIKIIGKATGGRFGYSVSFLGKLCPNEPTKIGVSAPNEEGGRGVVYIYAYDDGELRETQRLVAQHIYDKLKGFGSYIITQPSDIDKNKVADIAIGAYKSGHAVIFRGKPVVKWDTKLLPNSETIAVNITSFSFKSCILFQGMDYIENVAVKRVLHVDPGKQRCHLNGKNIDSAIITVDRWKERCEEFNVTFKKLIDEFHPLVVEVTYNLIEEKRNKTHVLVSGGIVTGKDNFCSKCPTTKPIRSLRKEYPFAHGCGDDNICMADLLVNAYFPTLVDSLNGNAIPFVVGSYQDLELRVTIENKGDAEKSYKPYITVVLPSGMDLKQYHSECEKIASPEGCNFLNPASNQIYIRCDVGKELRPSAQETVEMSLDLDNLNGSATENIIVCAASASKDVNYTDNFKSVPIHFKYNADITITGKAETEQFNFKDNDIDRNLIDMSHIYEVQKFGISPVEKVKVEIFVPYAIEDDNGNFIEFLKLKYEGTQDREILSCSDYYLIENESTLHRVKRSINEGNTSEVNLKNMTAAQAPSNRTLYLNCSSQARNDYPEIKCKKVNCSTLPLENDQELAKVKLFMELDTESLKKVKKEKDIILLETLGKVEVVKPNVLSPTEKDRPDQMWTSTMFIGDIPAGKVAVWIIILAIIVGILLLALLGYGLYKAGFFERKKREELDSLKNQASTEEEFAVDSQDNLT